MTATHADICPVRRRVNSDTVWNEAQTTLAQESENEHPASRSHSIISFNEHLYYDGLAVVLTISPVRMPPPIQAAALHPWCTIPEIIAWSVTQRSPQKDICTTSSLAHQPLQVDGTSGRYSSGLLSIQFPCWGSLFKSQLTLRRDDDVHCK